MSQSEGRCWAAGFADGGRGHESRDAGASRSWKKQRNDYPRSLQEEPAPKTHFGVLASRW